MKRSINYSVKDSKGERVLDYASLLSEKENQVVELEKKIQNLEERLRRAADREQQLEEHVVHLTEDLKRK
jgi:chromosome segregation ATPase